MSFPPPAYPPRTYLGEGGEVTARFRPVDSPPELPRGSGAAHYLATGASTGGRFGLYRWDMGAEPAGAQPHFHRTISESFFVLSGAMQLYDGRDWRDAAPGDFAYVPEGGVHGFRNESGAPASLLILFAPGAPREAYFEGLVAMAEGRWTPTHEELQAFLEEHDNLYI
ncbi:cupin domain-containing protein [Nocardioides sp. cx-173]|uniref:cupin domain-containing protein n=1 Tax=Nocardioides sp. cx-173 TaxID=2898796 RepID=UPI001E43A372|nr:cupin domain-containing protein [Nocardioides sp. cx-173]MCD4526797.1 cupin domain-containing protein [Nocardioides sp. cx-173]UGB43900.1 cupin domain-containing protein [Nocardioides sp. cx-173]